VVNDEHSYGYEFVYAGFKMHQNENNRSCVMWKLDSLFIRITAFNNLRPQYTNLLAVSSRYILSMRWFAPWTKHWGPYTAVRRS